MTKRAQKIGQVKATETGFEGTLNLLNYAGDIVILPVTDADPAQKSPDYTVNTVKQDGSLFRIGSGWDKVAQTSKNEYVSLCIDYFEITSKAIWPNLVQNRDDEEFSLLA